MRMFDEVVNDITKDGYCVELTEEELRRLFEQLSPDLRWEGVYHGWEQWDLWQELCKEVHKYMRTREE